MARVKGSLTVDAVSGSLGGVTFRVGPGGGVMALRGRRLARGTAAAIEARSYVGRAAAAWAALSAAERSAWALAAARGPGCERLGRVRRGNGWGLYLREAVLSARAGESMPGAVPSVFARKVPVAVGVTFTAGTVTLVFLQGDDWAAGRLWVWGARACGRDSLSGAGFRFLYSGAVVLPVYGQDLVAAWDAVCGVPAVGELFRLKVIFRGSGYFSGVPWFVKRYREVW